MTFPVALRPVSGLLGAAVKPYVYWDFGTGVATPTRSNRTLPGVTATNTPAFTSGTGGRDGWVTLDDTEYYTFDAYDTQAVRDVFNLGEGVMLFWARVNVVAASTGQQHLLSIGAGAGPHIRFNVAKSTSFRPDVWLAFDGDTSATQYAGGSNEFAGDTDTNVAILIDNRPGVKTLYRYVNGANVNGTTWSGKGALTIANAPTQRIRMFADALNTPGSTYQGAVQRMGLVNFGADMPTRINSIIQGLHDLNGSIPAVLAQSM